MLHASYQRHGPTNILGGPKPLPVEEEVVVVEEEVVVYKLSFFGVSELMGDNLLCMHHAGERKKERERLLQLARRGEIAM